MGAFGVSKVQGWGSGVLDSGLKVIGFGVWCVRVVLGHKEVTESIVKDSF